MSKETSSETKRKKTESLNVKDFTTIAIFFVINTILSSVVSFIGIVPITFLLVTMCQALVLGIPTLLFYSRVKKPGMLFIMALLAGGLCLIIGLGPLPLIVGVVLSFICEYLLWSAKYMESRKLILAYAISTLANVSIYVPLFFPSILFFDTGTHGKDIMTELAEYGQRSYIFLIIVISTFVAGIIGGYLGHNIFKKHFESSGIV